MVGQTLPVETVPFHELTPGQRLGAAVMYES